MKLAQTILFCFLLFITSSANAQIEKVIVETYYISDANDASDTTGGILEIGTTTYRIYVDLMPGSKIRKIYGDANHALKFSSTSNFFNNKADGQTFAKDFSKNRLRENTVALDTWLTLGQTSRVSSNTYFGVLKREDTDGSFIGGNNNDGGSAGIASGLLTNSDSAAGIPLTASDGFDTMAIVPTSWADDGILDINSGIDSTIFGSVVPRMEFISFNASLQNSGVSGVNPDSNQVLIAQLTTRGEISFELNLEVEEIDGATTRIKKYVANGDTLLSDERLCPFLKYPPVCGCTDPKYIEYNPAYSCDNPGSCRNLIVFGCMDSLACNYDPAANFNISSMCCYPGFCNDRDISVVCPQLSTEKFKLVEFKLYPNPSSDQIFVQGFINDNKNVHYFIYDSMGKLILEKNIGKFSGMLNQQLDISKYEHGLYLFRIYVDEETTSKMFIKE